LKSETEKPLHIHLGKGSGPPAPKNQERRRRERKGGLVSLPGGMRKKGEASFGGIVRGKYRWTVG